MEHITAEAAAMEHLKNGNHCAETIAKTILKRFAGEVDDHVFKIASAFGGGIGLTHEETCGALTGGVIALGYLAGRTDPKDKLKDVTILVQGFKDLFQERFGSTSCPAIIRGFGPGGHFEGCLDLIVRTAGMLDEFLKANGISHDGRVAPAVAKPEKRSTDRGTLPSAPPACCGE